MTTPDPVGAELQDALGSAYELKRELTGGGMSRVFLATERALNRDVVVKVLPTDLAAGVNRERFRREARIHSSVKNEHVVRVVDAFPAREGPTCRTRGWAGWSLASARPRR